MTTSNKKIVFLRHGQSIWNRENRFTGWANINLTEQGENEARNAAKLLKEANFHFDYAYCSVLKRAINTLWITLQSLELEWIPQEVSWRLNERHYGALEGLNKLETAHKYGEDQVQLWRRSFEIPPPSLKDEDPRLPQKSMHYSSIPASDLPKTECLKDTINRVLPFWNNVIVPRIRQSDQILVVSHGNTIRGLIKHLDGLSKEEIMGLNIPTGLPLVYEFNEQIQPSRHYFLGDPEAARKAAELVANQSKISE